jgi:alanyl-tRNA synthetase
LQERNKELARENESLQAKLNQAAAGELINRVHEVKGVPVLWAQVDANSMDQLRSMVDDLRQKMGQGVIVLGSNADGKVQIVASVSQDYVKAGLHAGKLVKEVATLCGGGGGGRPDMAQAGGKQPERLPDALNRVDEFVEAQI